MEAARSIGVGSEEWALAHEALSKLCLKRAALDAEEGKWLLRAFRAATHAHFGFASFGEYIERLFGLGRRATEEKLRVATALEELPELERALRSGSLNWSAVREVTRVAAPGTEREWISAARGKTVREVERLVSGLAPGDRPKDPRRPERVRHVLRFEVGAETLATFREAMRLLQKQSEHRLNDDEALLAMAREILGGPRDAGRASYQVVVTQCEDCGRSFQHANGELLEIDPAIVEMCHCDAQKVVVAPASAAAGIDGIDVEVETCAATAERRAQLCTATDTADPDAHVCAPAETAERDAQLCTAAETADPDAHRCAPAETAERDAQLCTVAETTGGDAHRCAAATTADPDAHVCAPAETAERDAQLCTVAETTGGDAHGCTAGRLVPSNAHTGAASDLTPVRRSAAEPAKGARLRVAGLKRPRATQETPPAVRREVFFRDHGRCIVPGCRNATYVDLHHLELRSAGGGEDPDNLVVLCGAHHGAVHRGRLRIDGKVSAGLRVRHADGTVYGFMPSPLLAEASARAFAGLRNLGFPEKAARVALDRALASVPADVSSESLLRSAIAHAGRG